MEGNKRKLFDKQQNKQFKHKGPNKKMKWTNSSGQSPLSSLPSDTTMYRILCPSKKIGSVIGKGGSIIKALREETRSKITVDDSVLSSDERVITIYSSPAKVSTTETNDEKSSAENELRVMEPHCAAQDALLKVHKRIIEDDRSSGVPSDDDNENGVITVRLLVPNNMVGCILGKGGDVIKRLRSETDAKIRIFPPEQLPACAMSTDELVQIFGKVDVVKRALFEVSTLLHQNPRKGEPVGGPVHYDGQNVYPRGPVNNMLPLEHTMWPRRSSPNRMIPLPWVGGDQPLRFTPSGFNDVPPRHGDQPSAEFSMKILCAVGKIGGVIGKGGSNVKFIQQETGASIHVEDAPSELDERTIRVCAVEALSNPRSQTIEAILQLQGKTSEISEKGTITTRLLVPSNKIGCILGQGGQVINEMRKRTLADIRIFSKDDKPKCASDDEELIQISGNASASKDALADIASRLRVRTLRDTNAGAEPRPVGPSLGFDPGRNLPGGRTFSSVPTRASSSSGYEPVFRGGARDYEPQSYQIPPRYQHASNGFEHGVSSDGANSDVFAGRNFGSNVHQVPGRRTRLQDARFDGSRTFMERPVSAEHFAGTGHSYMTYDMNGAHRGPHQNSFQQSSYPALNSEQQQYTGTNALSTYRNDSIQPSGYRNYDAPHVNNHPNAGGQQSPYQLTAARQQGSYSNYAPRQGAYSSQQGGAYQQY